MSWKTGPDGKPVWDASSDESNPWTSSATYQSQHAVDDWGNSFWNGRYGSSEEYLASLGTDPNSAEGQAALSTGYKGETSIDSANGNPALLNYANALYPGANNAGWIEDNARAQIEGDKDSWGDKLFIAATMAAGGFMAGGGLAGFDVGAGASGAASAELGGVEAFYNSADSFATGGLSASEAAPYLGGTASADLGGAESYWDSPDASATGGLSASEAAPYTAAASVAPEYVPNVEEEVAASQAVKESSTFDKMRGALKGLTTGSDLMDSMLVGAALPAIVGGASSALSGGSSSSKTPGMPAPAPMPDAPGPDTAADKSAARGKNSMDVRKARNAQRADHAGAMKTGNMAELLGYEMPKKKGAARAVLGQ